MVLVAVFVWAAKAGKVHDIKSFVAPWIFIVWWGWAAISVFRKYIYLPHVQTRQRKSDVEHSLNQLIRAGTTPLKSAIDELRGAYPLLLEPRYRNSSDPGFDGIVELEEPAFLVTLFEKEGVIVRWDIR